MNSVYGTRASMVLVGLSLGACGTAAMPPDAARDVATSPDQGVARDAVTSPDEGAAPDATWVDAGPGADADVSTPAPDAGSDAIEPRDVSSPADVRSDVAVRDGGDPSCAYPIVRALHLPGDGLSGMLSGRGAFRGTTCDYSPYSRALQHVYSLHIDTRTGIILRDVAFTGTPGLSFSVRRQCTVVSSDIACGAFPPFLRTVLDPGDYFVVVASPMGLNYSVGLTSFVAAANATCADATPLVMGTPLTAQDISVGGSQGVAPLCGSANSWTPMVFYALTIPAARRAVVTATATSPAGWFPSLQASDNCSLATCVASSTVSLDYATMTRTFDNTSGTPLPLIVTVTTGMGTPAHPSLFDITVHFDPLP